jgi:hypothetical protein
MKSCVSCDNNDQINASWIWLNVIYTSSTLSRIHVGCIYCFDCKSAYDQWAINAHQFYIFDCTVNNVWVRGDQIYNYTS